MKLSSVFANLELPKNATFALKAPNSVGVKPKSIPPSAVIRKRITAMNNCAGSCASDAEFWGYETQAAYYRCLLNLVKAAEITGADNLPDVAIPVFGGENPEDDVARLEGFGRQVLAAAESQSGGGAA